MKLKGSVPFLGFSIFFVAAIFVSTSSWSGQTYELRKDYDVLQGSTIRQETNMRLGEGRLQYDFGGSYMQGTYFGRCKSIVDVTFISRDRKQLVIVSDYCDQNYVVEGEASSERETGVLEGETIIGERINGIWKHRLFDSGLFS